MHTKTFTQQKYCLRKGDCLELMKAIPDGSVDLVVTDIPYGKINRRSNGLRNLDRGVADVISFEIGELVSELVRVSNGSIYVFCATEQVSELRQCMVDAGLSTRLCIWEKTNPSPMNGQRIWLSGVECCVFGKKKGATFNEHCKNTVFRYPTKPGKLHPTQKPVELMERFIMASSNANDTVLDPFMGSGTTAVVAKKLGRKYVGFELEEEYIEIAKRRLAEEDEKLF